MRKTPLKRLTSLSRTAPLPRSGKPLKASGETKRKKVARYRAYLKSPEWKAKRKACIEAAGHRCECMVTVPCQARTEDGRLLTFGYVDTRCCEFTRLTAHHKTYARFGNELPEDLICYCKAHHDLVEDRDFPHRRRGGPEHISSVVARVMEKL